MPYIPQKNREDLYNRKPQSAGELNFAITKLCLDYLQFTGMNYQTYNDIIGALEGAKLEFYRRSVAPYENKKIDENGDVYE